MKKAMAYPRIKGVKEKTSAICRFARIRVFFKWVYWLPCF